MSRNVQGIKLNLYTMKSSLFIVNEYRYNRSVCGGAFEPEVYKTSSGVFTRCDLHSHVEDKILEHTRDHEKELTPIQAEHLAKKVIEAKYIAWKKWDRREEDEGTFMTITECDLNTATKIEDRDSLLDFKCRDLSQMIEVDCPEPEEEEDDSRFVVNEFRVRTAGYVPNSSGDVTLLATSIHGLGALRSFIEDKVSAYGEEYGEIKVSAVNSVLLAEQAIRFGSMAWASWHDKVEYQTQFLLIKCCDINGVAEVRDIDSLMDFVPLYLSDQLE